MQYPLRRQSSAQPLPFGPLQTSAVHKPAYHLQPGFTHLPSPTSPAVSFPSPVSPRNFPSIDSQLLSPVSPLSNMMEDNRSQRASINSTSSGSNSDESTISSTVSLSSESSSDFPATPPTSLPGSPACVIICSAVFCNKITSAQIHKFDVQRQVAPFASDAFAHAIAPPL